MGSGKSLLDSSFSEHADSVRSKGGCIVSLREGLLLDPLVKPEDDNTTCGLVEFDRLTAGKPEDDRKDGLVKFASEKVSDFFKQFVL